MGSCLLEKTALNDDEESGKQVKISLCNSLESTIYTHTHTQRDVKLVTPRHFFNKKMVYSLIDLDLSFWEVRFIASVFHNLLCFGYEI